MEYANMKANMPRWTKIYAIFATVTERAFQKKEFKISQRKRIKAIQFYFLLTDNRWKLD